MFKVNNKDTRATPLACQSDAIRSIVSIAILEQVNACWD